MSDEEAKIRELEAENRRLRANACEDLKWAIFALDRVIEQAQQHKAALEARLDERQL